MMLILSIHHCFSLNSLVWSTSAKEAVCEWGTKRLLRADKTHSTWLTMSDCYILLSPLFACKFFGILNLPSLSFIHSGFVLSWTTIYSEKKNKKNVGWWQNAAQSASYQLSRCQVILTKRLFNVLSEIELSEFEICVLSQFEFLVFFKTWVFEYSQNLGLLGLFIIWVFDLSYFQFLSFVLIWVKFLNFITISLFG